MTPAKQTLRHKPEDGVYGDCYRTAIACLLDVAPTEVPHFLEKGASDEAMSASLAWLRERGLSRLSFPFKEDLETVLAFMGRINPGIHYMLVGESRTGCDHNVICLDGAIVHDPSLDDAGIIGPSSDGFYWVEALVKV